MEEKDLTCRKLKEQFTVLETETAAKLADMDQYKKEIQVRLYITQPSLLIHVNQSEQSKLTLCGAQTQPQDFKGQFSQT